MATRPLETRTLQELASNAAARYTAANPLSQASFERATEYLPGADTRTVNHYAPFPVTIVRGEGARLHDLDGHVYLDFLNDYTAGLYGHSDPTIQAAVVEAAGKGFTLGGPTPNQQEFAELICGRYPSVERVRFTNSGTEANLMAISLARAATGRDGVLVFDGGYHGGPLNFSEPDRRLNVPFPWVVGDYNDAESARSLIEGRAGELACVLVEPMLGGGGCIPGTRVFLSALRDATQRAGVLLIFDEVQTSRLAPGGLQEALDVHADLTSLGKYLGGGASFGAFGGRADLMDRFDPRREDHLSHHGTHNNNALTMAAGLAGLRDVFTPDAVRRLTRRGDALRAALNGVAAGRDAPVQVTGRGSIMMVHFQRTPIRRRADLAATPQAARDLFHLEMLLAGFWVARRGFVTVSLAHDDDDCDALVEEFDAFLAETRRRHRRALA
ncbi:aspartate aminotransferase family protein [Candidatus Palauibacter sp.]|uniref:aspartate aminotransferase family protein n=1 Tax=Candidatus Palauibacter sp. TaxID=3101350 RepID=UPI003AF21E1A